MDPKNGVDIWDGGVTLALALGHLDTPFTGPRQVERSEPLILLAVTWTGAVQRV